MKKLTTIESTLEVINIKSRKRKTLYKNHHLFEAPNWDKNDNFIIVNREGRLYKIALTASTDEKDLQLIPSGFADTLNNDHGISPDGRHLVISHHSEEHQGNSIIYTLPIEGGEPKLITDNGPSYWHGWSPDGATLAYVAGRAGSNYFNIYTIAAEGGEETRLTFTRGLDDGPDYSPCGTYIYYNSYQSGMMQIWRMKADGSEQKQLIESPHSDWFPHPSPNGSHLVFIRYLQDQKEDHPFGQEVQLMLLELETNKLEALTDTFCGGQGSINVPSWRPNSEELAFVSYQIIDDQK